MSSGFVEGPSSKKQETTNRVEGGSPKTALKRRLDFGVEDIAPNERFINIRQQELGSPFTVYSYTGMDMQSEDTPKCLDLVFWPPEGMTFAGFELPVAAYVFSNGLDMSEILIPDSLARGTREMLWSLSKETTKWWLPTTFSEIAVDPHFNTQATIEFIEKKYMTLADNLFKKLIYLDSAKCSLQRQARLDHMQTVAKYLDGFLTADRFYEEDSSIRPKVSEFEFLEPRIGQQKELS
ncbi:hypothetical protein PIB30_090711, partial [Stylosanthes scabra]|nr:hypothetical protein [Stylosanthes scabra]